MTESKPSEITTKHIKEKNEKEDLCETCGEPMRTFMKDGIGHNLDEVYGCPVCDG